jgi:hypothetical protein
MTPWPAFFLGMATMLIIILVATFVSAARDYGDDHQ